ncbi:MAG TPA: helix-turn-helix domain-containing protein [Candidatus Limnocylindrales bacterium]|nr:helix-turn-helix domain-containing protein [Candidatus Limnocylindrales bacterium]
MDDARIGRSLRVLRQRRGLRQVDVARTAGVSQATISTLERGHCASLSIAVVRRVFAAVGAGFDGALVWRGASLDRLLDARHAALVGATARRLRTRRWRVAVEVTYSVYGERGAIDVFAASPATRACLVVEVKSELASIEQLGRKTDEKVRLARRQLGNDAFGFTPLAVGRLLVLPDTDAARAAVRRNAAVLDVMFPARGAAVRAWLMRPLGDMAGVQFVAVINPGSGNGAVVGVSRVRGRSPSTNADRRRVSSDSIPS